MRPPAEGTVSLTAGTGCAWNAASDQAWLSIRSATNGAGDAQIAYRVAANDTGSARTARITVGTASFTVQQAAAGAPPPPSCTFEVDRDNPITAERRRETGTVTVNTTGTCTWTAARFDGVDPVEHDGRHRHAVRSDT